MSHISTDEQCTEDRLDCLDGICRLAVQALRATTAAVYRRADGDRWVRRCASSDAPDRLSDVRASLCSNFAPDEVTIVDDADSRLCDLQWEHDGAPPQWVAIAPLYGSDETAVWGYLVIAGDNPRQAESPDRKTLHDLADTAGTLIASEQVRVRAHKAKQELKNERQERKELINELQRSNRKLEQFAYVASHDLQEPLRMVTSFLSLLQEEYGGELGEDADQYIEFAVDGARRMQTMIDGLLTYSRVGSSQEPFTDVEVEKIFVSVRDEVVTNHDDIDVVVEHTSLPTLEGRVQQLQRLFSNLLTNAVTHSGAHPRIDVRCREQDTTYLFSVADQGVGIAEDQHERIFDIFISGDRRAAQNSGIGLAICTSIVEEHGGRLWVDSVPGEGATFYFTLAKEHTP